VCLLHHCSHRQFFTMSNNGDSSAESEGQGVPLTDRQRMAQWGSNNNISDETMDYVIDKLGFTCMESLDLITMEDLTHEKKKMKIGEMKFLLHKIRTTFADTEASAGAIETQSQGAAAPVASTSVGATPIFATVGGQVPPVSTGSNPLMQPDPTTGRNTDAFIREVLGDMGTAQSSMHGPGPAVNTLGAGTYTWQDPQIYIKSMVAPRASSSHLDIVDFVNVAGGAVILEEVVSGSVNGQLIYKSGPAKPKLESVTLNQWSMANLAILYKLLEDGHLAQDHTMDYLSYTTRVHQLLISHDQGSVFQYDREYRRLQNVHKFRWGTDIPHILTVFLKPKFSSTSSQFSATNQRAPPKTPQPATFTSDGLEVCRNFNGPRGCRAIACRYAHACAVKGCTGKHAAWGHSQALASHAKN
jgi:hypothetical protein